MKKSDNPSNRNKLTLLAASKLGARLFRMSTGLFWAGRAEQIRETKTVTVHAGDVIIRRARPVHSGVKGMSDEVGFVPVVITADMVGQTFARYLAAEDKTGSGVSTTEQKSFIKMVRSFGGLAGVVRSDDDLEAIIRGEIRD